MSTITKPRVPDGLRDLMKDLTREILKEKPTDIYDFAENYFQARLPEKENYAVKSFEESSGKYDFSYIQNPQRYQIPVALIYSIIPEGLTNLIKDLIKAVLREQPHNLCDFAVEYFRHIKAATSMESKADTKNINYSAYENYFINKERFLFTPYVKCTCGRTLGEAYTNNISIHKIKNNDSSFQSKSLLVKDDSNNLNKLSENDANYYEKYMNSIYIIQRYIRRYLKVKKVTAHTNEVSPNRNSSEHQSVTTEPIISKQYEDTSQAIPIVPQLQLNQNETENIPEDASYTSASTALLSASESGRETYEPSTCENIHTKTIIEGVEIENDEKNISKFSRQSTSDHVKDETTTNINEEECVSNVNDTEGTKDAAKSLDYNMNSRNIELELKEIEVKNLNESDIESINAAEFEEPSSINRGNANSTHAKKFNNNEEIVEEKTSDIGRLHKTSLDVTDSSEQELTAENKLIKHENNSNLTNEANEVDNIDKLGNNSTRSTDKEIIKEDGMNNKYIEQTNSAVSMTNNNSEILDKQSQSQNEQSDEVNIKSELLEKIPQNEINQVTIQHSADGINEDNSHTKTESNSNVEENVNEIKNEEISETSELLENVAKHTSDGKESYIETNKADNDADNIEENVNINMNIEKKSKSNDLDNNIEKEEDLSNKKSSETTNVKEEICSQLDSNNSSSRIFASNPNNESHISSAESNEVDLENNLKDAEHHELFKMSNSKDDLEEKPIDIKLDNKSISISPKHDDEKTSESIKKDFEVKLENEQVDIDGNIASNKNENIITKSEFNNNKNQLGEAVLRSQETSGATAEDELHVNSEITDQKLVHEKNNTGTNSNTSASDKESDDTIDLAEIEKNIVDGNKIDVAKHDKDLTESNVEKYNKNLEESQRKELIESMNKNNSIDKNNTDTNEIDKNSVERSEIVLDEGKSYFYNVIDKESNLTNVKESYDTTEPKENINKNLNETSDKIENEVNNATKDDENENELDSINKNISIDTNNIDRSKIERSEFVTDEDIRDKELDLPHDMGSDDTTSNEIEKQLIDGNKIDDTKHNKNLDESQQNYSINKNKSIDTNDIFKTQTKQNEMNTNKQVNEQTELIKQETETCDQNLADNDEIFKTNSDDVLETKDVLGNDVKGVLKSKSDEVINKSDDGIETNVSLNESHGRSHAPDEANYNDNKDHILKNVNEDFKTAEDKSITKSTDTGEITDKDDQEYIKENIALVEKNKRKDDLKFEDELIQTETKPLLYELNEKQENDDIRKKVVLSDLNKSDNHEINKIAESSIKENNNEKIATNVQEHSQAELNEKNNESINMNIETGSENNVDIVNTKTENCGDNANLEEMSKIVLDKNTTSMDETIDATSENLIEKQPSESHLTQAAINNEININQREVESFKNDSDFQTEETNSSETNVRVEDSKDSNVIRNTSEENLLEDENSSSNNISSDLQNQHIDKKSVPQFRSNDDELKILVQNEQNTNQPKGNESNYQGNYDDLEIQNAQCNLDESNVKINLNDKLTETKNEITRSGGAELSKEISSSKLEANKGIKFESDHEIDNNLNERENLISISKSNLLKDSNLTKMDESSNKACDDNINQKSETDHMLNTSNADNQDNISSEIQKTELDPIEPSSININTNLDPKTNTEHTKTILKDNSENESNDNNISEESIDKTFILKSSESKNSNKSCDDNINQKSETDHMLNTSNADNQDKISSEIQKPELDPIDPSSININTNLDPKTNTEDTKTILKDYSENESNDNNISEESIDKSFILKSSESKNSNKSCDDNINQKSETDHMLNTSNADNQDKISSEIQKPELDPIDPSSININTNLDPKTNTEDTKTILKDYSENESNNNNTSEESIDNTFNLKSSESTDREHVNKNLVETLQPQVDKNSNLDNTISDIKYPNSDLMLKHEQDANTAEEIITKSCVQENQMERQRDESNIKYDLDEGTDKQVSDDILCSKDSNKEPDHSSEKLTNNENDSEKSLSSENENRIKRETAIEYLIKYANEDDDNFENENQKSFSINDQQTGNQSEAVSKKDDAKEKCDTEIIKSSNVNDIQAGKNQSDQKSPTNSCDVFEQKDKNESNSSFMKPADEKCKDATISDDSQELIVEVKNKSCEKQLDDLEDKSIAANSDSIKTTDGNVGTSNSSEHAAAVATSDLINASKPQLELALKNAYEPVEEKNLLNSNSNIDCKNVDAPNYADVTTGIDSRINENISLTNKTVEHGNKLKPIQEPQENVSEMKNYDDSSSEFANKLEVTDKRMQIDEKPLKDLNVVNEDDRAISQHEESFKEQEEKTSIPIETNKEDVKETNSNKENIHGNNEISKSSLKSDEDLNSESRKFSDDLNAEFISEIDVNKENDVTETTFDKENIHENNEAPKSSLESNEESRNKPEVESSSDNEHKLNKELGDNQKNFTIQDEVFKQISVDNPVLSLSEQTIKGENVPSTGGETTHQDSVENISYLSEPKSPSNVLNHGTSLENATTKLLQDETSKNGTDDKNHTHTDSSPSFPYKNHSIDKIEKDELNLPEIKHIEETEIASNVISNIQQNVHSTSTLSNDIKLDNNNSGELTSANENRDHNKESKNKNVANTKQNVDSTCAPSNDIKLEDNNSGELTSANEDQDHEKESKTKNVVNTGNLNLNNDQTVVGDDESTILSSSDAKELESSTKETVIDLISNPTQQDESHTSKVNENEFEHYSNTGIDATHTDAKDVMTFDGDEIKTPIHNSDLKISANNKDTNVNERTQEYVKQDNTEQTNTDVTGETTNNEETTQNIGIQTPETFIGNQNLTIGRIRNFNEGLLGSISGQRFAETHLRSFWKEYVMNNSMPLSKYDYRENEPKELPTAGTSQQHNLNQINETNLVDSKNEVQAIDVVEPEIIKESIKQSESSPVKNPNNSQVNTVSTPSKDIERIPRYFYGVPETEPNCIASHSKRKSYKEPTAFTIAIDDLNKKQTTKIPKTMEELSPKSNKDVESLKSDMKLNLRKLELSGSVDAEPLLDAETPTKLFQDLNEFEYEIHDVDLDITYTIDEIIRLKIENDSQNNSDDNDENINDASEYSLTPEPMLQTIIELSESETPKPPDQLHSIDDDFLANLERISDSTSTSWTTGSKEDNSFVSDEFLDEKSEYIKQVYPKSESGHTIQGGIYEFSKDDMAGKEMKSQNYEEIIAQAPTPPNDDPFYEDLKETAAKTIQGAYRQFMQKRMSKPIEHISKLKEGTETSKNDDGSNMEKLNNDENLTTNDTNSVECKENSNKKLETNENNLENNISAIDTESCNNNDNNNIELLIKYTKHVEDIANPTKLENETNTEAKLSCNNVNIEPKPEPIVQEIPEIRKMETKEKSSEEKLNEGFSSEVKTSAVRENLNNSKDTNFHISNEDLTDTANQTKLENENINTNVKSSCSNFNIESNREPNVHGIPEIGKIETKEKHNFIKPSETNVKKVTTTTVKESSNNINDTNISISNQYVIFSEDDKNDVNSNDSLNQTTKIDIESATEKCTEGLNSVLSTSISNTKSSDNINDINIDVSYADHAIPENDKCQKLNIKETESLNNTNDTNIDVNDTNIDLELIENDKIQKLDKNETKEGGNVVSIDKLQEGFNNKVVTNRVNVDRTISEDNESQNNEPITLSNVISTEELKKEMYSEVATSSADRKRSNNIMDVNIDVTNKEMSFNGDAKNGVTNQSKESDIESSADKPKQVLNIELPSSGVVEESSNNTNDKNIGVINKDLVFSVNDKSDQNLKDFTNQSKEIDIILTTEKFKEMATSQLDKTNSNNINDENTVTTNKDFTLNGDDKMSDQTKQNDISKSENIRTDSTNDTKLTSNKAENEASEVKNQSNNLSEMTNPSNIFKINSVNNEISKYNCNNKDGTNNYNNMQELSTEYDKNINDELSSDHICFEPTAPAEDDIQSIVPIDDIKLNEILQDQAARKIQKAVKNFIGRKSTLSSNLETTKETKSNWFVGDEPIIANDSLPKTESEISFEETEAYVELTTNPPQYLVDSSRNLEAIDANNFSRSPTAPVSNSSINSVNLENNQSTNNVSKDTVSVMGNESGVIEKTNREHNQVNANSRITSNSKHDEIQAIDYTNLIDQFLNSERHYSEAVNHRNKEIIFTSPDITEITKILSDFTDSQKEQCDSVIPYERLEEPCIKKSISLTRIKGDDMKDAEIIADTAINTDTSSSSDIDDTEESLSTKTVKLHKPDMAITKMQQRRDSTTKISNLDKPKDFNFDEPLVAPMDNLDTDEEGIVVNKLQREETRESSAQSDFDVIIGGDKDDNFNFLNSIDIDEHFPAKGSLKRVHTIAGDGDAKSLLKNVTIDESIKYIEPPDYELSSGSLCLDDDTAENIRRKMMAYSFSEADSDCFDKFPNNNEGSNSEIKSQKYDDFNISTALVENGNSSTETESTIVSAVTKIQAGARGYLTRKRLGKASMTSDGKSMPHDDMSKASFGNAAISESLEYLVQEAAAKRIQKVFRQHYKKKLAEVYRKEDDSFSPEFTTSLESTLAQKRSIMLQRGDALRNDSTPDEGNSSSNGSGSENGKPNVKIEPNNKNISCSVESNNFDKQNLKKNTVGDDTLNATSTAEMAAKIRAKKIEENKRRWLAMRQNSMPVQIDSEVLRVIPKYMRKKIKSAEGEKKKDRRRMLMD